jgi:GNAT superfamily N-acetyltransferase
MVKLMSKPNIPKGYPNDLEETVILTDGRSVRVRPILPSDYEQLSTAAETADQETLLNRFFTSAPHLSAGKLHYLAEVDYESRLALVALDENGHGIAVARYEGHPDADTAEVAVVVDPAWRRNGLASILLARLEPAAAARGITNFEAIYLPQNRAIAGVFCGLGYSSQHIEEGVAKVDKHLA